MSNQLAKSHWTIGDNDVRLGMEISKVDKKRRMVTGWATVDNVDQEGDQVTAEASLDAFARSRMNLREMHKKDSAVGRIVSFKQDSFRAPDGQLYKGIFVKVYVSKGAEDTWQKVLDKTLNGFSIGGEIVKFEPNLNKSTGTKGKKVLKYNLNELSLVDNPGNEYSDFTNIFKIRKSADGSVTSVTGMIEDCKVLNVYHCETDGITKEEPDESQECPICGEEMEYIGIVEDTADRGESVSAMVQKFISTEGGARMTKNKNEEQDLETVETGHEAGDPQEVPTPANDDIAGEADDEGAVEEVDDEGHEISKMIDGLKNDIERIVSDNNKTTTDKITALEKAVTETRNFVEEKISNLGNKIEEVDKSLETQKARIGNFEKLLNKVNARAALRKSVDASDDDVRGEQDNSAWNGAFSVKNLIG
jgi:putative serine protease XkdF